jgi:hypothetical protein
MKKETPYVCPCQIGRWDADSVAKWNNSETEILGDKNPEQKAYFKENYDELIECCLATEEDDSFNIIGPTIDDLIDEKYNEFDVDLFCLKEEKLFKEKSKGRKYRVIVYQWGKPSVLFKLEHKSKSSSLRHMLYYRATWPEQRDADSLSDVQIIDNNLIKEIDVILCKKKDWLTVKTHREIIDFAELPTAVSLEYIGPDGYSVVYENEFYEDNYLFEVANILLNKVGLEPINIY